MMKSFVRPICAISMVIGISAAAFADDYYVSSDGNYGIEEGADADHRFTDLQAAVTNAIAESTIWVADGFVCNSGSYDYTTSKTTFHTRLYVGKKMTIRSKSGDWRTGAEIVGKHAEGAADATPSTWIGDGALSCAYCAGKASVTFIGFRFTGGASYKDDANQLGGGVVGATLRNCFVANCAAGNFGGGLCDCDSYDSMITNCHVLADKSAYALGGATRAGEHSNDYIFGCKADGQGGANSGGTLIDCVVEKCYGGYGGGVQGTARGCTFIGCWSSHGGGAARQSTLYNCTITNCSSVAASATAAYSCLFVGNAENASGSAFSAGGHMASNCTFTANGSPVIAAISTSQANKLIDCVITNNLGDAVRLANASGSSLLMTNCVVDGVGITSAAVYMKQQTATDKPQILNAYNSVFGGPVTGGNFYNCLIRGAKSQTYPTVFCDSSLATLKGGTTPLNLYNCTIINNVSTYSAAGNVAGGYVNAYNTIIRDNTAPSGKVDELATAVNCCLSDTATATTEKNCIREDPALYLGTGDYFYPTANSPCRTAGSLTAYELTPTDQAGQPRTSNGGTTVAIGACEFDPTFVGASIVCLPETTKAPASGKFTVTCSGFGDDLTYSWDFTGDGTIDLVTNVATVAYYYPEAGDYRANVTVTDGQKTVTAEQAMSIIDGYFVSAKNIHEVSGRTGGWGVYTTDDGHEYLAYTNLQQAIDAAGAGDIVWVDDDFVCDEGSRVPDKMPYRIVISKDVTVRSKSGDGRRGPIIRGAYATGSDGTLTTRCGEGAVCGVFGNGKVNHAKLVGFRIERCATLALSTAAGGGASAITLENCLVSGCGSYFGGGGLSDVMANDCIISNCTVNGASNCYGAGTYSSDCTDSLIVANENSGLYGGGMNGGTALRCTFADNKAGYGADTIGTIIHDSYFCGKSLARHGGHSAHQGTLYNCVISNQSTSGVCVNRADVYDSLFIGNASTAYVPTGTTIASNCVFTGNSAASVLFEATSASDIIQDCVFSNNTATCVYVHGNANVRGRIARCSIDAGRYTAINVTAYNAANTFEQAIEAKNCTIRGLVAGAGNLYNCLIADGTNATDSIVKWQATNKQADEDLHLYNCTVANNDTPRAATIGGGRVVAVNTIVKGNAPKAGLADTFLAASNSCIEASAVVGDVYQCVSCNPRFMGTPGDEYVPRAAKLYGKGQVFDWMSDPEDVRSQDLAGKPCLHEGTVDMGAFAMYPLPGFLLLVR